MSEKISVLIIGQNAESSLDRCLLSVKAFDEVIYVDGGSTDSSLQIAQKYPNVRIYKNPWPGFIEQRNFSLTKASYDWCFMIDTDEAVCEDTACEIYRVVNNNPNKLLYKIMRTEFYLGKPVEKGLGKGKYHERLLHKNHIKYSGGVHHIHLIDGVPSKKSPHKVGTLHSKFRILHNEKYGLTDWTIKLPRFALLVGSEKLKQKKRVSAFSVLISFPLVFLKTFFRSFSLGKIGFVIAVQEAIYKSLLKLVIYEGSHIHFDKKEKEKDFLG